MVAIVRFLKTADAKEKVTLKMAQSHLKNAKAADIKAMVAAGVEVFTCTVGLHDSLWMPAGFIFTEKVGATTDLIGIKYQFLNFGDADRLRDTSETLTKVGCPNAPLQDTVDFLTLLEE